MASPFQFDLQMKIFVGNIKHHVPEFCFLIFTAKMGKGERGENKISRALTSSTYISLNEMKYFHDLHQAVLSKSCLKASPSTLENQMHFFQ
eukprot:UN28296